MLNYRAIFGTHDNLNEAFVLKAESKLLHNLTTYLSYFLHTSSYALKLHFWPYNKCIFLLCPYIELYIYNFFFHFIRWNQLDVAIVFLSVLGIVLEELKSDLMPINPTIMRVMRVLRIARGKLKISLVV